MVLGRQQIPTDEVHAVLSNARRRHAIRQLSTRRKADVSELATTIAAAETGETPPPTDVRESVYASLHQTHLPKLDDAGIVSYDPEQKQVRARDEARYVSRHLHPNDPLGIPWDDHYRIWATLILFGVVGTATNLPVLQAVPSLAWATVGLAGVAISTAYQLWVLRRETRNE